MKFIYLMLIWIVESHCTTEYKQLNDGNRIPAISMGILRLQYADRINVPQSMLWGIEAGFRHFDTAALYLTEDKIGEAIKEATSCGMVTREELFITTKLPFNIGRRNQVVPAIRQSLKRLQLDCVDQVLIHTPVNVLGLKKFDYLELWRGLEDAKRMGLVKSIGVSNFNSTHINRILVNCRTTPATNEIETNPSFAELELVAYCQQQDIVVMGYAPLGFMVPRPFNNETAAPFLDDPIIANMANKYGVSPIQIALRYLFDRFIIPIVKSEDKNHISENIDIFDFSLTPKEVRTLNEFNRNAKVYLRDYDGLFSLMASEYAKTEEFVRSNKLTDYYETFGIK